MKFEEKVRSMTMKEIILAMIRGLREPHVKVNMDTFGAHDEGVCFGCAATNTICEIAGKTFDAAHIKYLPERAGFIECSTVFLDEFENAIDHLRNIRIQGYNDYAIRLKIPQMRSLYVRLPILTDYYTQADLDLWEDYANTL